MLDHPVRVFIYIFFSLNLLYLVSLSFSDTRISSNFPIYFNLLYVVNILCNKSENCALFSLGNFYFYGEKLICENKIITEKMETTT